MKNNRRFTLESYVRPGIKHICPNPACAQKEFTRYIYIDTGEYVADTVGICNRRKKCGYHYRPSEYFRDHKELKPKRKNTTNNIKTPEKSTEMTYIPQSMLEASVKRSINENNLVKYLRKYFNEASLHDIRQKYFFGTAKTGGIIYWQIDMSKNVRAGKIINYDPKTGKRLKNNIPPVDWIHKKVEIPNYVLNQCFFGERLLAKYPDKPIAIVEGEKTAIICALLYPDWNWLATGSMDGLSEEKCKVLNDKIAYLFPDVNAQSLWTKKANELKHIATFIVSDFLYNNIPIEKRDGQDIADFLLIHQNAKKILGKPKVQLVSAQFAPAYGELQKSTPVQDISNELTLPTPPAPIINVLPISPTEPDRVKIISNLHGEILPTSNQPKQISLAYSKLGGRKLEIGCGERGDSVINFYLVYKLITAGSQEDITKLFCDQVSFDKTIKLNKLPDWWRLRELKANGFALISQGRFPVSVSYSIGKVRRSVYSGFLCFSIPEELFINEKEFDEAIERLKLLQNVVLVYTNRNKSNPDRLRYVNCPIRDLNVMTFFGDLPPEPNAEFYWCMYGYEERWLFYLKYLEQNLKFKLNPDDAWRMESTKATLVLDIDPKAWFNPNDANFINWQAFVSQQGL